MEVSPESRGPSWSWVGVKSGVGLFWLRLSDNCTYLGRVASVVVRNQPQDEFGCVQGGELVLDAPYRHLHLWLGSYSGSLPSPASMAQRALTRLGPLPETKKLAQLVLMRPDYLTSTYSSRSVVVPSSSTDFTLIQIAKTGSMLYLLVLQPLAADSPEGGGRQRYRRVGLLGLHPWKYDDDKYVGEEMTDRLVGAAYREVTRQR